MLTFYRVFFKRHVLHCVKILLLLIALPQPAHACRCNNVRDFCQNATAKVPIVEVQILDSLDAIHKRAVIYNTIQNWLNRDTIILRGGTKPIAS
ncbi:MAG: hypothetical protein KDC80_15325 [Saprospiraceae bacterium]|nr:hypothetical protein [Saprospiraceae bacterium]